MMSKDIQWKYKTKGKFEDYESHLNAQIELAYHQKKSSVTVVRGEEKYKIVFADMTEEDEYSNITEVRRIDLRKGVVLWDFLEAIPQYCIAHPYCARFLASLARAH